MARSAPISLRVEPPIKEALEELATADRRTLASYIELILIEHLRAKKKLPK